MRISVQEAADALRVHPDTIGRWLNGSSSITVAPSCWLETEELCATIGLEHKTLVAFLTGYDMALSSSEGVEMLGVSDKRQLVKRVKPVMHTLKVVRYSLRAVALVLASRMEKNNEIKPLLPGCRLLPPAEEIPGFDADALDL